jgi:hypothetical protein
METSLVPVYNNLLLTVRVPAYFKYKIYKYLDKELEKLPLPHRAAIF